MHSAPRLIVGVVLLGITIPANGASAPIAGGAKPAPRGKFVRISADRVEAVRGAGVRARLSLNYGIFVWQELDAAEFAKLRRSGIPFEDFSDGFALTLGETTFDPLRAVPAAPPGLEPVAHDGGDLRLVQFVGPTRQEWLDALERQGLRVVQYLEPFSYIVYGPSAGLSRAAGGAHVRWTGEFAPAYRILPRWRNLGDAKINVRVQIVRAADVAATLRAIEGLGAKLDGRAVVDRHLEVAHFNVAGSKLQNIATMPGVYSVQPEPTDGGLRGEMSNQVNVNNVNGSNQAFPGYQTWLTSVGLSGAGVIIANVDGGVQDTHPNLVNRMLPCTGSTCGGATSSSHGTHTAGIMAADGSSGVLDSFGFLRGQGMAPGANLVEQLYSPTFTQPNGMLTLMLQSYQNGALLSGNSWGPAGTPRGYDGDTRQVDVGVRDTDSVTPGDQPLSYVLSFMNGNGGTGTQGTPDEGKNIFTIGSTKMQNSGTGSQILQINDLSSNSAHGPALDGRTIPHMVAPGCYVDSTIPTNSYGLNCGTSMASPHVSGAVALFIEYYRGLPDYANDPSAAMIKAAFLVTSRDLAGNLDADGGILGHPFDSKQGWGRMDAEAAVAPELSTLYFDNPTVFDNTGEQWIRNVSANDPSKPVKIMLVWTDAPGHGLGGSTPAWNNDLDLVVEDGVNTFRGNAFNASGWSQAGGAADPRNNTEGVFIGPTAPGSYTIRVVATNINSNARPNQGDATDQDFAIVCYNCAADPGFVLGATPNIQSVCAPNDAVYTINVTQIQGFTDPVTLSATGNPAGTTVNFAPNPVTPPGSSTMTIGNTGAAAAGSYAIQIDGVSGMLNRTAGATLRIYNGAPGAVTLTSPADMVTNQPLRPTFAWSADPAAASYAIEVASDAGFASIVASASGLLNPTYTLGSDLAIGTTYYWRARAENPCGVGANSAVWSFTTRVIPAILLVDDDDNGPDVRSYYTTALDALGRSYDIWNTNNTDNEPTAAQLSPYKIVIWFTGDEFGGFCGPSSTSETALATFLNSGKRLFMCSQDYLYDRDNPSGVPTAFMQTYLGMASPGGNDVSQTTVTGAGSVFAGYGPYTLSYPFTNFSDRISPDGTAEMAFNGNAGSAGLNKATAVYRTVFFGFPWEAIPTANDRRLVMQRILDWFTPQCGTVRGDLTGDGQVTGADLPDFVECYLGGNTFLGNCSCADMDNDLAFSSNDISLMTQCELGMGCP